ncbi:Uncharacterised protein [Vibrio cholerae]|uniref:Uncharacterized protein n=1 Tax=Vibrio cholerae TaxID=666 RepID=A0A655YAA0_VIBCL|nr:Uncharacterised protein [Vibrio cholerae]CSC70923.1 Uncharacterised protein [Vibrio cholerae]
MVWTCALRIMVSVETNDWCMHGVRHMRRACIGGDHQIGLCEQCEHLLQRAFSHQV